MMGFIDVVKCFLNILHVENTQALAWQKPVVSMHENARLNAPIQFLDRFCTDNLSRALPTQIAREGWREQPPTLHDMYLPNHYKEVIGILSLIKTRREHHGPLAFTLKPYTKISDARSRHAPLTQDTRLFLQLMYRQQSPRSGQGRSV